MYTTECMRDMRTCTSVYIHVCACVLTAAVNVSLVPSGSHIQYQTILGTPAWLGLFIRLKWYY